MNRQENRSGGRDASPRRPLRATFISIAGALLALVVAPALPAQGSNDLLDPSQLGAGRKHAAGGDGLLAPPKPTAAPVPLAAPRSNRPQPGYARDMAERVVTSLDLLTQKAVELLAEIRRLQAAERKLEEKIQDLETNMAAEMDDYRNGLFCSGCGKTKTYILAHGDTFPHEGQHIIQPTQEQIDAKERELQAPIDQIKAELRASEERRKRLKQELDEAISQIDDGISLWRTSASFEAQLINDHEADSVAAYQAARAKIDDQINQLQTDIYAAKDKTTVTALADDIAMWNGHLAKLEAQRREDRRAAQNRLTRASQQTNEEVGQINGFIMRGTLGQHVSLLSVATTNFARVGGFNSLGGLYRLGDASPERHDEVLPSVRSFVVACIRNPRTTAAEPTNAPAPAAAPIQQMRGKFKDLLDSLPDVGPKDPPKKMVPVGGIRG